MQDVEALEKEDLIAIANALGGVVEEDEAVVTELLKKIDSSIQYASIWFDRDYRKNIVLTIHKECPFPENVKCSNLPALSCAKESTCPSLPAIGMIMEELNIRLSKLFKITAMSYQGQNGAFKDASVIFGGSFEKIPN